MFTTLLKIIIHNNRTVQSKDSAKAGQSNDYACMLFIIFISVSKAQKGQGFIAKCVWTDSLVG